MALSIASRDSVRRIVRIALPVLVSAAALVGVTGPASATQVEVGRSHPIGQTEAYQDSQVTLVKYWDDAGHYRFCVASYHDPLHVGAWGADIAWSANNGEFWRESLKLPGEGKLNCTDWEAAHGHEHVSYEFGGQMWVGDL